MVFDSECLLCNGWVQFLIKHDKSQTIQFASIQGSTGKALLRQHGLSSEKLETLLVQQGNLSWQHTEAILRIMSHMGWPWKAASLVRLVPRVIRDYLYRQVARNRYSWFGKEAVCRLPEPNQAHRFLD